MSYAIELKEERCIACGACSVACMDENDLGVPLRRCETAEEGRWPKVRLRYRSVSCRHCDPAPCLEACPMGCFTRSEATGFVLLDSAGCVGCGACRAVCQEDALVPGPDGRMRKCGGCEDRVRAGLLPACVKVCPMEALRLRKTE